MMGLVWDNRKADAAIEEIKKAAVEFQLTAGSIRLLIQHMDETILKLKEVLK